ncbi:hypothetical protein AVEN_73637-1 [Araneus ventricosus]|uniref:Uncharacterized protein n=1 Tax=Araneus ventricosus TaxID=182803 RepID=A0A4Y2I3R4_ARAVE|nr:hypothetical protein AVEN_73637-1 [Araneus ventricosus]
MTELYGVIRIFNLFVRIHFCFVNIYVSKCLKILHFGNVGVGFLNGEPWKELRKFFVQVLKERGIITVKDSLSGSMYEAINSTVDLLNEKKEEPVNIIEIVTTKCNSILRRMLFGDNGMSEEQMREIIEVYEAVMQVMMPKNLTLTGDIPR